jgi:exopolyphosphatase/guanosine-5'-triphosphate,3'-diphosphate pyrophosphatase
MVAAIARYHRRSLPKKRHESWQLIEGREQRRTVASMALLLRLAVALDRRPAPLLAGLQLRRDGSNRCSVRLEPMLKGQDLSVGASRPVPPLWKKRWAFGSAWRSSVEAHPADLINAAEWFGWRFTLVDLHQIGTSSAELQACTDWELA